MKNLKDPRQKQLFNPYGGVFDQKAMDDLNGSWQGVFRHIILEQLPAKPISKHFSKTTGRPTKELYSAVGLIFLMDCMNWTKEEAVDAYKYNMGVHYALNLEPVAQKMTVRSLERYIALFQADDLAAKVMQDVTVELIKVMGLNIQKQRLDSTHVFSDMAILGRLRLMKTAIKRFLTQVDRHDIAGFETLDTEFRDRYGKNEKQVFALTGLKEEAKNLLRQQVAEDLFFLINHFADNSKHVARSTYKNMQRIFQDQCELKGDVIEVLKKTGGDIMVSPSDPDATLDGHKGPGYQVQLSETCHADNEVQLITCAIAQTAVETDPEALQPVLDQLQEQGMKPSEMVADTAYCGDNNVQQAAKQDVELIGPATPKTKSKSQAMGVSDFDIDIDKMVVESCPAGHKPISSEYSDDSDSRKQMIRTVMDGQVCKQCHLVDQCAKGGIFSGGKRTPLTIIFKHRASSVRLAKRREDEKKDQFKDKYRIRSGIEATNSCLKRKTGLGRLRVRGRPSVFRSILLKVAGWNMFCATRCAKIHEEVLKRAEEVHYWHKIVKLMALLSPKNWSQCDLGVVG